MRVVYVLTSYGMVDYLLNLHIVREVNKKWSLAISRTVLLASCSVWEQLNVSCVRTMVDMRHCCVPTSGISVNDHMLDLVYAFFYCNCGNMFCKWQTVGSVSYFRSYELANVSCGWRLVSSCRNCNEILCSTWKGTWSMNFPIQGKPKRGLRSWTSSIKNENLKCVLCIFHCDFW